MSRLSTDQKIFTDILAEMLKVFVNKNIDYGVSYSVDDVIGVIIRLGDKTHRLKTLSHNGYQIKVRSEKLRDTLMDLANYSVIALMLMQKRNVKKKSANRNNKQKLVQQSKNHH
jgi:hypothetical protein